MLVSTDLIHAKQSDIQGKSRVSTKGLVPHVVNLSQMNSWLISIQNWCCTVVTASFGDVPYKQEGRKRSSYRDQCRAGEQGCVVPDWQHWCFDQQQAKVRGTKIHQKQTASGSRGLGWGSREKAIVYKVNSLSPKALCLNSQRGSLIRKTGEPVARNKLTKNSQAKLHYPLASIQTHNTKEFDSTRFWYQCCPSRTARQIIPKGRELMNTPH